MSVVWVLWELEGTKALSIWEEPHLPTGTVLIKSDVWRATVCLGSFACPGGCAQV